MHACMYVSMEQKEADHLLQATTHLGDMVLHAITNNNIEEYTSLLVLCTRGMCTYYYSYHYMVY